jgi:adenine-specific DNA-methyltransferase
MKSGGNKGEFFSPNIEFVLVYAKQVTELAPFRESLSDDLIKTYNHIETEGMRKGEKFSISGLCRPGLEIRPNQRYWVECPDGTFLIPKGTTFPSDIKDGSKITPRDGDFCWRWSDERYKEEKRKGNIFFARSKTAEALIDTNGNVAKWNVFIKTYLTDRIAEGKVPSDLIEKWENRVSSAELKGLGIPFSFAKPSGLIKYLLQLANASCNSIILDFFSGSATTAHAVMQLNAEDGGNRKFILVQLPEVCAEDSEAAKAGYKNICEIGKERIRRAGKKIQEEIIQRRDAEAQSSQSEEADLFSKASLRSPRLCDSALKTNPTVDIGFRVLKIDSSSLNDVSATVGETNQMMFDKLERIKSDRTPEDILFQLLIETHIPLSDPIAKVKVGGNEVFFVGVDTDESLRDSASPRENYMDAPLVACLDRSAKLTNEFFLELAAFKPGIVFFRDDAFNDDAARINVEQIFKQNSPNTIVKVI